MENWPRDLMKNIDYVTKLDVPGSLVVYGSNNLPLLAFNDSIIFAGCQFGLGRVFVTSHEKYVSAILRNVSSDKNEFEQLWSNLKNWFGLTACTIEDIQNAVNIDNISLIPKGTKLLYWISTCHQSYKFIDDLRIFINDGGNLICGACPWGWLINSPGKNLEELSLNIFLQTIGISYSPKPLVTKAIRIPILNYDNLIEYHFYYAFKNLQENISSVKNICDYLLNSLEYLPNDLSIEYSVEVINKFEKYVKNQYIKPYSTDQNDLSILLLLSTAYKIISSNGIQIKAPYFNRFPGDYYDGVMYNFYEPIISIKSKFNEFHFTGYYLPAGCTLAINVLEGSYHGWSIRIGCHADSRLLDRNSIKRFPIIHSETKLKSNLKIANAFGGVVYLVSPNGSSFLKFQLKGVINAPLIDITKKESILSWNTIRNYPGLWTEFHGNYIAVTLPSVYARKIQDPSKILKLWDKFILSIHEFKGTSVEHSCKIRVVADIQVDTPQSGYPLFIPMELIQPFTKGNIFSEKIFEEFINWKLIHQISHFFTSDVELPKDMREFITNIFTVYSFELSSETSLSIESILSKNNNLQIIDDYFDSRSTDLFKNYLLSILFMKQLVNSFGWDSFKTFFRELLSQKEKPSNRNQFILEMIELYSSIIQRDIAPLFYFWNLIVPKATLLKHWLPCDFITQRFSSRLTATQLKYNL